LVSPDVLIPRPETEFLVGQVLKLVKPSAAGPQGLAALPGPVDQGGVQLSGRQQGPLIVDIGTGSGCIAIALAVHLPMSRIIATDISQPAIELARRNASIHGVANRINFMIGDLLCPLEQPELEGRLDFIACNPLTFLQTGLIWCKEVFGTSSRLRPFTAARMD